MDDGNVNNAVFTTLKPLCDRLIVEISEKAISDLIYTLETLPAKAVQNFQSYITFPIEVQLLKTSNDREKQMLVDCLTKLLSLSHIDSVNVLLQISTLLNQQVVTTKNQIRPSVTEISEELKLSVTKCLAQLWHSAMSDVLYDVYTRDNYPRLSPVVFMLVELAKNEKMINLRVAALECLLVLCYVHESGDSVDAETQQRAQNVVMLMLPGIVTCCASIAAEASTQNHKITVANIQVWSRVVSLVMADGEPAQPPAKDSLVSITPSSTAEGLQQLQRQWRTAAWLRDTAERLTPVTEVLLCSQTHTHWKVRRHLALASHTLLKSCPRNMSASMGSLVCCLIVLAEDELKEVSDSARQALAECSQEFELDTGQPLLQLIEAAFYSLLTRAPRIMQGTDESSQLTCLSLMVGYLRLQGTKLRQVLNSSAFLHRLLLTLLHVCRLETSHISLLENCSIREVHSEQVIPEPWKDLMYCNSAQKVGKLQDMCCVLRENADLQTITHTLIDLLDSSPQHSKEIILLLNYIIAGGEAGSMKEQSELVCTVVSVYLEPRLWSVPFSVTQPDSPATTIPEAQSNIVQVALLVEGLGVFALVVGGQHFSLCLLRCLYPMLECAGSPLHPLASAGLTAIQNVAEACVSAGVTELVRANVDYLSHHIRLRLRRAHRDSGVLRVLAAVMRHTTIHVLPSLHEIIQDVLVQSCDEFQEHNASSFLRVFLTFLECVREWEPVNPAPTIPGQPITILQELLEYHQNLEAAYNFDDQDEVLHEEINQEMFSSNTKTEEEYLEDEESKPKNVAPSIKLTVAVLERSLHFLPSKDEQRQILVLDILNEGVLILRREEDHLLPIVHKIWSPLVNRFESSLTRPLVMHRAFLLLCTLADTARDFIRQRTLKQVLPAVCRLLQNSASQSLLKDLGSMYRLTQLYKLQRALLTGLPGLAIHLALQERDLHNILVAATPYLSDRQPTPLQELCQQLYKQLASIHPNLVWLQLISVWSPSRDLVPPTSDFTAIKLDTCCDQDSEFKKNVSELLEFVDS